MLLNRGADIEKVAQAVAESDKKIGFDRGKGKGISPIVQEDTFKREDLEPIFRHAEFIASAQPKYRYANGEFGHSKFVETYLATIESYASNLRTDYAPFFADLARKIEADIKNTTRYRVVDVIGLMDRNGMSNSPFYTKACSAAFLTMEWVNAPLAGQFSSSKSASFIVDDIAQAELGDLSSYSDGPSKTQDSALIIEFPMLPLLQLPLCDILYIRNMTIFRILLERFASYRLDATDEIDDLLDVLHGAKEFLTSYLSKNDEGRRMFRRQREEEFTCILRKRNLSVVNFGLAGVVAGTAVAATTNGWTELVGHLASAMIPISGFRSAEADFRNAQMKLFAQRSESENRLKPLLRWDAKSGQEADLS